MARNVLVSLLLVAVLVTLAAVTWSVVTLTQETRLTLIETRTAIAQVNATLPATQKRVNAILTNVDAIVARGRTTMGQIEKASRRQQDAADKTIAILDRTDTLLQSANETVGKIGDTSEIAGETIRAIGNTTLQAQQTVRLVGDVALESQRSVKAIGDVMASPAWLQAANNIALSSAHIEGALKDVEGGVHSYTHPSKKRQVYTEVKSLAWILSRILY